MSRPAQQIAHSDTRYSVSPVVKRFVPYYWDFVEKYIRAALEHANGEMTAADVKTRCEENDMQLWVINRSGVAVGACTTELVDYPRLRRVRVVTLGGENFDDWGELLTQMLSGWGAENGAHQIEAYVRKGFSRKLTGLGYAESYVTMCKDIRYG